MIYYGSRLSENISKREPEGYLICKHVPITRTGTQVYLADELDLGGDPEKRHKVIRPEEEVFSPATIASFEGMPVTNDHPSGEVTADNIQWLQKGHAQNIRRGTGNESEMLIADLIITDPETIQAVLDGKREISCGYNYDLSEEDGHFVQRQIRGNHIAIVDQGRAGHRVCIHDSKPNRERRNAHMKKVNRKNILSKMFAAFAQDAEPEELEEAAEVLQDVATDPEVPEVPEEKTPMTDEDPMEARLAALEAKIDQLLSAKTVDAAVRAIRKQAGLDAAVKNKNQMITKARQIFGEVSRSEASMIRMPSYWYSGCQVLTIKSFGYHDSICISQKNEKKLKLGNETAK